MGKVYQGRTLSRLSSRCTLELSQAFCVVKEAALGYLKPFAGRSWLPLGLTSPPMDRVMCAFWIPGGLVFPFKPFLEEPLRVDNIC